MLSLRERIKRLKLSLKVDSKPDKPVFFEVLEPRLLLSSVSNISAVAASGTPFDPDPLHASANVRQEIVINGADLDMSDLVQFPSIASNNGGTGIQNVNPTQVSTDGTSMKVVVPDNAMTGDVTVVGVGGSGSAPLQIVPTIIDIDLASNVFGTGSNFTVLGSGFIEGELTVNFGATQVVDTDVSSGPNVYNHTQIGAGLDRSENDAISLKVPANASTGLITVETPGGTSAALLISLTQIEGIALQGTPTSGGLPSANPGQTVRILGGGFDLTTEAIFPTINTSGTISNLAVLPDFVNVNGTMMEVRVPNSAITGNLRVIGAAGTFPLQVVPTLELVEQFTGGQLRLLGGGFTENNVLTVDFDFNGVSTQVPDTGTSIDVRTNFLANDTLYVNLPPPPVGGSNPISVTVITIGGTSPAINIAVDDPAGVGGIYSLAIFPSGTPDAGRFVVSGTNLEVLDPVTLATVRTINRPGPSSSRLGLTFLTGAVTVQDPVRGSVLVPAGSLVVVNDSDTPDRLYYLDPAGTGTILADVPLGGPTPVDEAGAVEVAYHAARGTLFVLRNGRDLVTEIDPATGAAIQSFHSGFAVNGTYVAGGLAVHPTRDTLLLGGSSNRLVEIDPGSGRVIGSYDTIGNTQLGTIDLRQQGIWFESTNTADVTGLAFDNAGILRASLWGGRIVEITLPGDPIALWIGGVLAASIEGNPADPLSPSANTGQRIQIFGSGYNRFTEVEFERIPASGAKGFVRVRADAVSDDGTIIEVVVPDEAVSGSVRVSGAPGAGLFLQIVPMIRPTIVADRQSAFDNPVEGTSWTLFGSGLVEGATRITFGGVLINDNSASSFVDIVNSYFVLNGRLNLTLPERVLAGPVRVETVGGSFQLNAIPIRGPPSTGLDTIEATALSGTPVDVFAPSANTGQLITLRGYGFTSTSNIIFTGVAEDGTRSQIVTRPASVVSGGMEMRVYVPALAVT
ncbi:MAG: hypothetical protein GY774_36760, partial [Planctomycetes bacterium]|nr:hypothetical protein [Planctomycetota bacterium]